MFGELESTVSRVVADHHQVIDPIRQFIVAHFGQNGLYAAYLLVAAGAALVVYKLIKLSFELLLFVVLPAAIVAFGLTFVLPFSFFHLMPATTALFTLGLVLRNVALSKG